MKGENLGRFGTREIRCEVCGSPLGNYCTVNVCQECCLKGLCPNKSWCKAYHEELERSLQRRRYNPSSRESK